MQEIKGKVSGFLEKITTERFFYYYIITVMLLLPITEFFVELHSERFTSQPIIVEMAGYVGIFAFLTHFVRHQKIKYYLSDLLYFFLFIFALLSAVFTINKDATWHGFYYDEWLFNFVAYFSLMLAGTMIEDKGMRKNIIAVFVIVTVIQAVTAALQTCGVLLMECYYDTGVTMEKKMAYGLIQHSNWYAGLSVLLFACTSGVFLFTGNKFIRNAAYAISMLCFYTLMSAEARLGWVGVFAYILFMAVSIIVMKIKGMEKEKLSSITKRFLLLIVGMAAIVVFVILVCGKITSKVQQTSAEISNADSYAEGLGTGRVYIWKYGLKSVPDHWAFGIGLDNYRDVFFTSPDYHEGMFTQGKGHNEYIHYLVTQGVFQFITYLTLIIYTAVTGVKSVIKNEDKEERFINWIFLGMFFGYAAQALFNSSVVNVAPYFWITIGMCLTKKNQHYFGYAKEHKAISKKA